MPPNQVNSHQASLDEAEPLFPYHSQDLKTSNHWADRTAQAIIRAKGNKDCYVLAAGITPSGTVHIGNFRELIVVDLVALALRALGKKTRFIFSWDNFDPFRKVPANFPEKTQEGTSFSSYLKLPLREVPDPSGKYSSYAKRNETLLEQSIHRVGVTPEFIYQSDHYTKGLYVTQLKQGLRKRAIIRNILNDYRKEPLPDDWYPVVIFCHTCKKHDLKILGYDEETTFTYFCNVCKCERTLDFTKTPLVKFLWRIDWPMRWSYEKVDFEPGGKDHSTDGGSFDTAREIAKQVFDYEAPFYLQYDFVLVKGEKSKMSSSTGNVITIADLLEVYEPALVRYLYAAQKPNVDFSIALDKDVIKHYEAFDRLEREYFGEMGGLPPKKTMAVKRAYEFSSVAGLDGVSQIFPIETLAKRPPPLPLPLPSSEKSSKKSVKIQAKIPAEVPAKMPVKTPVKAPFRAAFRHLTNVIQIYDFAEEPVLAYYTKELQNDADKERLRLRIRCASHWLRTYAEEDFCFTVRKEPLILSSPSTASAVPDGFSSEFLAAFNELKQKLADETTWKTFDEKTLYEFLYDLMHRHQVETSVFFEKMYNILIAKPKGPRLSSFMLILGRKRLLQLFSGL